MKIAILVGTYPPGWIGGKEIATDNIAKYLAARGNKVDVITSLNKGQAKKRVVHEVTIHQIKRLKVRYLGVPLFWLQMFFTLMKIRPDVVHDQGLELGVPSMMVKKIFKIPYVVWGRGGDVYSVGNSMKPLLKLTLRNADEIIVLTADMKKTLQKICNSEMIIIPNGLDLARFEMLLKNKTHESSQVEPAQKKLIFVGRLRSQKGLTYLIRAMKIIEQKNQSTKLIIVGEGPEENNLKQLAHQLDLTSVSFIGQIPNEDVPRYLLTADVFILPSISEGLPNVILEALASGLPIVASKVGGLPEIIKNGENGFLIEPKNVEQIAEKTLLLLENDELRKRMSANNKEKAKEYSWETIIDEVEKVYCKVINNSAC